MSRVLTIILNFDQSKRFALLLPAAAATWTGQELQDRVLQDAKNKFRIKQLSTVFVQGGGGLPDRDLPSYNTQLWVGKGESYAGPPHAILQLATGGDIRIIGTKSYIDESAIKQLQRVAGFPGVCLAVGMPDLHPGGNFPIGCAVACEGIYPSLIGSDVGCGIGLYRLSSSATRAKANPRRLADKLRGLDGPWSGSSKEWLMQYGIEKVSDYDEKSLGTVGAGNHFAEICTPESIIDPSAAASLKIDPDALYLLVHTGSRGLGQDIQEEATLGKIHTYIEPDSPRLTEYLAQHDYAVKWAVANRDLVAHRIREALSPTIETESDDRSEVFKVEKILDVTHNSVVRQILRVGNESQTLWIHRKGAAPADKGVVPCPGSRGDFSWLIQPTGDGQHNAHSLAHGAGRRYGRQALHVGTKIDKASLTTTKLGSEVVCTDSDLLIEERPEGYKDVKCVVEDMEDENIGRGIVVFRPVVTYKVRKPEVNRK